MQQVKQLTASAESGKTEKSNGLQIYQPGNLYYFYDVSNIFIVGHIQDRTFDIFDFLPLVALLVATGLIISGLFPTGISTLGINNGKFWN